MLEQVKEAIDRDEEDEELDLLESNIIKEEMSSRFGTLELRKSRTFRNRNQSEFLLTSNLNNDQILLLDKYKVNKLKHSLLEHLPTFKKQKKRLMSETEQALQFELPKINRKALHLLKDNAIDYESNITTCFL